MTLILYRQNVRINMEKGLSGTGARVKFKNLMLDFSAEVPNLQNLDSQGFL